MAGKAYPSNAIILVVNYNIIISKFMYIYIYIYIHASCTEIRYYSIVRLVLTEKSN